MWGLGSLGFRVWRFRVLGVADQDYGVGFRSKVLGNFEFCNILGSGCWVVGRTLRGLGFSVPGALAPTLGCNIF